MQETEITVQVFNTKDDLFKQLKNLGYNIVENFQLNDWYFTKLNDISNISFQELINNSILIREVVEDGKAHTQICYKKKYYDSLGNVISEEKTKTNVEDRDKIISILTQAGLNNYCDIHNDSYVFTKGNQELAIQVVDGLGIFIEYEEDDSMPKNMTNEEKIEYMINIVKKLGLKLGTDYSCKKVLMKLKNK
ncbi:MAG TPA: hypothetical protein DD621_04565 [Clostridiales bacterium]|nr:hypothetical protein [Clostridiales bacterium]